MTDSTARTVKDDLTSRAFGPDKPVEERGPVVQDRDALRAGMICRFLRMDKAGDYKIVVLQLPTAKGVVFSLWSTQQLAGKLRYTRKGEVVLITYLGQAEDADKVHQWTVQPYTGTPAELNELVRQHPWDAMIDTFEKIVAAFREEERKRRAARGDGAPPHEDHDRR